jgi:tetratricopeptide (TPR) repeat protein
VTEKPAIHSYTCATRYLRKGEDTDLNPAIYLFRKALVQTPPIPAGDELRFSAMLNLATCLDTRFERKGEPLDLEEAIALYRKCLGSTGDRASSLNNLASSLCTRFNYQGNRSDLDESILLHREALALRPLGHPLRWKSLNNLANALHTAAQEADNPAYLEEAVSFLREARGLSFTSDAQRAKILSNLGSLLDTLFRMTCKITDLDDAVVFHREALGLTHGKDQRHRPLNNLAAALCLRWSQTGQIVDVNEAVMLQSEAVALLGDSHIDRPSLLDGLASSLSSRFVKEGKRADIDKAIALHRKALSLLREGNRDYSMVLRNLAVAIFERFDHAGDSGQVSDLDDIIPLFREELRLLDTSHPDLSSSFNNLSIALLKRFRKSTTFTDLKEAIEMSRKSLQVTPREHPLTCTYSIHLGAMLMEMYFHNKQEQNLEDAMAKFRAAVNCESAPVLERSRGARMWADHADPLHKSALEAYEATIQLLPRLATLNLDLQARQQILIFRTDGVARNAAACAIRFNDTAKAIELLEAGRAIFWSQALQLRTPLDELDAVEPARVLAERLREIQGFLEKGSFRDVSRRLTDTPQKVISMDKEASRYRRLNDEWLATLSEVREMDEFHDFLLPKSSTQLLRAAADRSIVVLNAGKSECAALIISKSNIMHVPLPNITATEAQALVKKMRTATSAHKIRLGRKVSDNPIDSNSVFRSVLETLWSSVVRPVIQSLNLEVR